MSLTPYHKSPKTSAVVTPATGGDWIVLATDRHRTGQPMRALTVELAHLERETEHSRFARFPSEQEAKAWLESVRWHLIVMTRQWTYTVASLPERKKV